VTHKKVQVQPTTGRGEEKGALVLPSKNTKPCIKNLSVSLFSLWPEKFGPNIHIPTTASLPRPPARLVTAVLAQAARFKILLFFRTTVEMASVSQFDIGALWTNLIAKKNLDSAAEAHTCTLTRFSCVAFCFGLSFFSPLGHGDRVSLEKKSPKV
jgi:hypothetical protein